MGKTTVLLQLALHISKNHRTLFFSPDLHERALVNRIISLEAHLPIQSLEKSKLDDPSFLKVLEATRFIHEQSLFINADYFHDIPEYLFFIENIILTKKMEVVFFDNVTSFGKRLGRHHHRWVSMFMRGLRKLAKELNITFILSNDVSRQCEKISMHKRPLLQHLSEQGDLHENADKVIFIYRPLYYGIIKDEIGNDIRHRMEWIVAKNKLGPEGTAVFHFDNALIHIRETSPNEAFYNGSSEKE
jgi:replicative DNA helicase